jgi:hypothetical protein
MARILTADEGKWYDELRAVSYYLESDVEKWILLHAKSLFPHHFVFPFKRDIFSQKFGISKRPDLALISRNLSSWTIVEVEVGTHDLDHVLDQVRVFANGDYNPPEIAEYAKKQIKTSCDKVIGLPRLTKLFSKQTPSILVIADTPEVSWQSDLEKEGVDLCIFQIYKSVRGLYIYRTSGQYPIVQVEEAHCRPLPLRPNLLEVINNFEFKKVGKGKSVEVAYEGRLTRWDVIEDKGKQYLQFVGTVNPLSPAATYKLFRDKMDRYHLGRN